MGGADSIASSKVDTSVEMIEGLHFVNISSLDFGEVEQSKLGEVIKNSNPLKITIHDELVQEHRWNISVRAEVAKEENGHISNDTEWFFDGKDAKVTVDKEVINEQVITRNKYHFSKNSNAFGSILSFEGKRGRVYDIQWEAGTIGLRLGKDLLPGNYTMTTHWQIVDSIDE